MEQELWEFINQHEGEYVWPTANALVALGPLIAENIPEQENMRQVVGPYLAQGRVNVANWIIRNWGRIYRLCGQRLGAWMEMLGEFTQAEVEAFVLENDKNRVSSWSKLLSFASPAEYAILDSRTSVALNIALWHLNEPRRFHMPLGQNKTIQLARQSLIGEHEGGEMLGYMPYLELLQSIAEINGMTLLDVEQRLFAKAPALAGAYNGA